jgi:DNA-binding MarR family transcriptional regulator
METQGLIKRQRSDSDERKVIVELTKKGKQMQKEAARIPEELAAILISGTLKIEDLIDLKDKLNSIIKFLSEKQEGNAIK